MTAPLTENRTRMVTQPYRLDCEHQAIRVQKQSGLLVNTRLGSDAASQRIRSPRGSIVYGRHTRVLPHCSLLNVPLSPQKGTHAGQREFSSWSILILGSIGTRFAGAPAKHDNSGRWHSGRVAVTA